ncbi:hypothetical protein EBV26_21120 [bacterium]|nr:hypothetical protein [bacterium]
MTNCISRRALGDHLRIRLINEKGEDGRWIWMEYRCPNIVCNDGDICKECSNKVPKYKYQAQAKCNHGIVGGEYHSDSKLYGSAYYLAEIKKGWKLTEHDEFRAKAAVNKAISNMAPRKKVQVAVTEVVPVIPLVTETLPVISVPTKRKYVRKTPEQKDAEKAKAAEKARKPRVKKEVKLKADILLPQTPVIENPLEPKFIEVLAQPITITDTVVAKVKKIKCQGKDYYYDSASGKVYGISVNGVGAYKGRYKEEEDVVDTTFPDSDEE